MLEGCRGVLVCDVPQKGVSFVAVCCLPHAPGDRTWHPQVVPYSTQAGRHAKLGLKDLDGSS